MKGTLACDARSDLGVTVDRSHVFQLRGQSYRVRGSGLQAIELAFEILRYVQAKQSLLPLRSKIRGLRLKSCTAAIAYMIEATTDRRLRLIAIWLRGQCHGHIGISVIAKFAADNDVRTRMAVAKALRNLNEWSVLRMMATYDHSERVRRLASPRSTEVFSARLGEFTKSVASNCVSRHRRFLYVSPLFEMQAPARRKSAEFIRQVLDRIRSLVHGKDASTTETQDLDVEDSR